MGSELGKVKDKGLVARAEVSLHELSSSTDIEKAAVGGRAAMGRSHGWETQGDRVRLNHGVIQNGLSNFFRILIIEWLIMEVFHNFWVLGMEIGQSMVAESRGYSQIEES